MKQKALSLFISLVMVLSVCTHVRAQSLSANVEDVGGYYRLSFSVNAADVSNFTPPSFKDFEVLSGPSQSTSSSYTYINGRSSHSQSTTFTYILSARKSGRISIGAASVRVGGKVLHSRPLQLNAVAGNSVNSSHSSNASGSASSSSRSGMGAQQVQQAGTPVSQRDLFIDVTPSRTRVKEQEAVLLTYRIHARVGVALSNTSLTQKPDFKGLISQEIPIPGNQIQTSIEHKGGTTYRTGTILQYVVFPQKSGVITVPSITFDCTVVQQDNTLDLAEAFFNGGGTIGVQVRRTVPVLNMQVDPLPQPRPANFSGAVGKYLISGSVTTPSVKTNDIGNYRIILSGLGNLKLITAPKVNFPKDFSTYDPKTTDKTKVTADGLNGQLVFDYTFVPRNVGDYTIPAAEFVFFDTETNTYKTVKTDPIKLHVAKGKNSDVDIDRKLALLKGEIRDLRNVEDYTGLPEWGTASFYTMIVIVLLLLLSTIVLFERWMRSRADEVGMKRRLASKQALLCLKKAREILSGKSKGDFYAAVSQALISFISASFNLETSEVNNDNIRALLLEKHIADQHIDDFINIIEECHYAQYAPSVENLNREALYAKAEELIGVIERELKRLKNVEK